MKLFQKLLLAPAALGLLAPVAANAAAVDIAGLSQYGTEEQVTSITQFSDVQPTDWAYQALSNLIERYGCVAGYPNGTYRGNRAMTRYEAAALLNACLDRITEVTDELKRLMKEFERELAVLRGRVDGLEARVGELEATQFSTTTKLRGVATFVVGGTKYTGTRYGNDQLGQIVQGGSGGNASQDSRNFTTDGSILNPNGSNFNVGNVALTAYDLAVFQNSNQQQFNRTLGGTTFNYDVKLFFDTSFTGKDLLRTMLRSDNFNGTSFATGLTFLETAFDGTAENTVQVNRLFYNFPVGKDFSVTVGGRVRTDDAGMLGVWPSVYPADTVLDFFTYAGSPGAYNLALGSGAGFTYNNVLGAKGVTLSTNYVSENGDDGNPNTGGIVTNGSSSASVTQLAYTGSSFPLIGGSAWSIAAAYTFGQNIDLPSSTPLVQFFGDTGSSNSVGISGYWVPEATGWVPSVSAGWGVTSFENAGLWDNDSRVRANSWYLGFQWPDTFVKGNDLGMAVGQAPFMTTNGGGSVANGYTTNSGITGNLDSNYMWEWWYKFQVTDNITVTPALFYINNVNGQLGKVNASSGRYNASTNAVGGLLKTTFKF